MCPKGHEWPAMLWSRVGLGTGCPICSNKQTLAGFNDIATTDPNLASQWHPTLNTALSITSVTKGSGKKVWWLCEKGHEYKSTVANRSIGQGCPICAPTGFSPALDGWVYFLIHHDWLMFQIGISNYPETRLAQHERKGWGVIDLRGPMPGDLAASIERGGLRALESRGALLGKRNSTSKFDGYTESWPIASLHLEGLKQLIAWIADDSESRS
jgi:hypothetical protein